MEFLGKEVLITGANGGLAQAIIDELLQRGASTVNACSRDMQKLESLYKDNSRIITHQLDITDSDSINTLLKNIGDVDIIINNAGINSKKHVLQNDWIDFDVNVKGTMGFTRSIYPKIKAGGAILNIGSVLALINLPALGMYSASKSALHSLTQGLRAQMLHKDISVYEALPGPMDTKMTEGQDMDKTSCDVVAKNICDEFEANMFEIYPDEFSKSIVSGLRQNPKAIEDEFAQFIQ